MSKEANIVKVLSLRNNLSIADECHVAVSFFDRLRGLIGKKMLRQGQGLLLSPCNDIHMWMMSIPIDVVFLRKSSDGLYLVTSTKENLRPWRPFPVWDYKANVTLELPIGTIQRCDIREGDELCTN